MKTNKVILNGDVLIDLSNDNVVESFVVKGIRFHKADGNIGIGTLEIPTNLKLKEPTISIDNNTETLNINDSNGDKTKEFNIYANGNLIATTTDKNVVLSNYMQIQETQKITVVSVGNNTYYENSEHSNSVYWLFKIEGTKGLQYELSNDGTYYIVSGIGNALGNENIVIGNYKNGLPIKEIGNLAFGDDSIIKNVTISMGVISIDKQAFAGCVNLSNVTIPESVIRIGNETFLACTSLLNITVDSENPNYKSIDGNLYSKDGKALIQYACGKLDSEFTIPNGVTIIGGGAFAFCENITKLIIPDGVTYIGDSALWNCSNLTSIRIPDSLVCLGDTAIDIEGCPLLQYNEYDNAYYLGNEENPYVCLIKAKNQEITSCNIHSNTKLIGRDAFNSCKFTTIEIPNSVRVIEVGAFSLCGLIQSITIPASVTSIGDSAFAQCRNLLYVYLNNNIKNIGYSAFASCPIRDVYYSGTEEEFNKIKIGLGNSNLVETSTIHYNYVKP